MGVFYDYLNCINGTKSRKASTMFFRIFLCISQEPELRSKKNFPIFSFFVTCLIQLTYTGIPIFRYSSEHDVTHSYIPVDGQSGKFTMMELFHKITPPDIYLLKVNNRNTRIRCEVC